MNHDFIGFSDGLHDWHTLCCLKDIWGILRYSSRRWMSFFLPLHSHINSFPTKFQHRTFASFWMKNPCSEASRPSRIHRLFWCMLDEEKPRRQMLKVLYLYCLFGVSLYMYYRQGCNFHSYVVLKCFSAGIMIRASYDDFKSATCNHKMNS